MMKDIEAYTRDKALKNLVLAEVHLADYAEEQSLFCLECLQKHMLMLAGLAEECVGVCKKNGSIWAEIAEWADRRRADLKSMTKETAEKLKAEAREFRKRLEEPVVQEQEVRKLHSGGHIVG